MKIEEVIQKFERFASIWNERNELIPIHIRNNILYEIHMTDSIDEGKFLRALDFREESMGVSNHRYLIDASRDDRVVYDDVLERGRKDGADYPGRFNYKRGIEATDVERIADSFANEAFRGF
jgi:hypothetical protein